MLLCETNSTFIFNSKCRHKENLYCLVQLQQQLELQVLAKIIVVVCAAMCGSEQVFLEIMCCCCVCGQA